MDTLNCLRSLSNQTFKDFEVIVLENSGSRPIYSELKEEAKKINDCEIKVFYTRKMLFFTGGVNHCTRRATGEILCLLNNDVLVGKRFLEKVIGFIESKDDSIGLVNPKIVSYYNKNKVWFSGCKMKPFSKKIIVPFTEKRETCETDYVPGTAMFVKRDVFEKLGCLDDDYKMYWEDVDISYSSKKHGYKNYYFHSKENLVFHKGLDNQPIKRKKHKIYLKTRNSQIFVWKFFDLLNVIKFYFSSFLYNTAKQFIFSLLKFRISLLKIIFRAFILGFYIGIRKKLNKSVVRISAKETKYITNLLNERRKEKEKKIIKTSDPKDITLKVEFKNSTLKTKKEVKDCIETIKKAGLPKHKIKEKNWDSLNALSLILQNTNNNSAILDAGAEENSLILRWLSIFGYKKLKGVNISYLERRKTKNIEYIPSDLTRTAFPNNSFDVIICLSVIEHGVNKWDYFREANRILKKDGLLITSTDYWNRKMNLELEGKEAYGNPVFLYDKKSIKELIETAQLFGFELIGNKNIDLYCEKPIVHWKKLNLRFTFVLFGLKKIRDW